MEGEGPKEVRTCSHHPFSLNFRVEQTFFSFNLNKRKMGNNIPLILVPKQGKREFPSFNETSKQQKNNTASHHPLAHELPKRAKVSYSLRPIITEPFAKKKCPKITEPFHFPIQY